MFSSANQLQTHQNTQVCFNIQEGTSPTYLYFFQKFTLPNYHLFSAFRLIQPTDKNLSNNNVKKSEIVRKHRGNYRKYTVAQKEEAVKQVYIALLRFYKAQMQNKFLKNMEFLDAICYAGRRMDVSGRKVVGDRLMDRCSLLFIPKQIAKSY